MNIKEGLGEYTLQTLYNFFEDLMGGLNFP